MIRVEFIRQVRRRRTWGMIAALVVVPIIVAIANYVQDQTPGRRQETNFFTLLTGNGVNFALFNLLVMSNFFLVVIVAAFAGESVSGEATWGTLRYLLVRPVGRVKLILSKLFIAAVLALASTFLMVVVALAVGTIFFGWEDAILVSRFSFFSVDHVSAWDGVGRLALASAYFTACLLFVVALGMFLSTLTDSTAAAVVGTIVIVVTCGVLLQVPSLEGIRPIVPTKYWAEWLNLFQPREPLASEMAKGLLSTAIYTTIFSVLAIVRFQHKDILS